MKCNQEPGEMEQIIEEQTAATRETNEVILKKQKKFYK